jgi:hypothetical protein
MTRRKILAATVLLLVCSLGAPVVLAWDDTGDGGEGPPDQEEYQIIEWSYSASAIQATARFALTGTSSCYTHRASQQNGLYFKFFHYGTGSESWSPQLQLTQFGAVECRATFTLPVPASPGSGELWLYWHAPGNIYGFGQKWTSVNY